MGVVVDDRVDVGAGLKNGAVNGAFAVHDPSALIDRIAVEVEFHDVVERRSRHKKAVGPLGMAEGT